MWHPVLTFEESETRLVKKIFILYITCFMLQELASVTMRRFLSSSNLRDEKEDLAAARRDRALHAWRNLGSPPHPTRPGSSSSSKNKSRVISTGFLLPGTTVAELCSRAVAAGFSAQAAGGQAVGPTQLSPPASLPRPVFITPQTPSEPYAPALHSTPQSAS
jgi:hypothetical protein